MGKAILKAVQALLARVPATPPQTPAEFDALCQSVALLAGVEPTAQNLGQIATFFFQTDIRKSRISKRQLVLQMQRMVAQEHAYNLIQKLRAEQAADAEKAKADASAGTESAAGEVVREA